MRFLLLRRPSKTGTFFRAGMGNLSIMRYF
jgi:hypothetical protein